MNYLLKSWIESLSVFKLAAFKIFALLTLKYALDVYARLRYFGWFLIGGAILAFAVLPRPAALITVLLLWLFYSLCTVRSSVERKQYRYFIRLSYYLLFYAVVALLLYIPVRFFLLKAIINRSIFWGVLTALLAHIYGVGLIFFTLFMLDTYGTIAEARASVQRAFIFVAYNYPFCVIITAIFIAILALGAGITYMLFKQLNLYWVIYSILVLLVPFFSCFLANFYIKRVHEQFSLYYPDKK
jgi:hypothetical protein